MSDLNNKLPEAESPLCPNCGNETLEFNILVPTCIKVTWNTEDGYYEVIDDFATGGLEWDDSDDACCPACNWSGKVSDIRTPEEVHA